MEEERVESRLQEMQQKIDSLSRRQESLKSGPRQGDAAGEGGRGPGESCGKSRRPAKRRLRIPRANPARNNRHLLNRGSPAQERGRRENRPLQERAALRARVVPIRSRPNNPMMGKRASPPVDRVAGPAGRDNRARGRANNPAPDSLARDRGNRVANRDNPVRGKVVAPGGSRKRGRRPTRAMVKALAPDRLTEPRQISPAVPPGVPMVPGGRAMARPRRMPGCACSRPSRKLCASRRRR